MIKKIIKLLFNTSFQQKKLIIKDTFLTDENENITRLIKLVKSEQHDFDNSLIIDIGADNGETSKLFSKAFPNSKVVGFEANPKIYTLAKENCEHNKNITLYNNAISDKKEIVDFYVTSNDVSSSINKINQTEGNSKDYKNELDLKTKVSIQANILDEYTSNQNVLILKIDTQGHELKVLEGAKETLKKTKFVLIEMSNHNLYINGCKYFEVDDLLRKNNFTLADIIVTYRKKGMLLTEYDAVYMNNNLSI